MPQTLDIDQLAPHRPGFADEADVDRFAAELGRYERGEIDAEQWRQFRLLNGVYGQRQDGFQMVRVKLPQGILTVPQLGALAEVAERWSNGKGHVTTRQNVQFHFVDAANAEAVLRHVAAAGITTWEACGNSVRTITGCPHAGTAPQEPFDPTPYAEALTRHLLHGPCSSTLPRKFKIAVGGCCGTDDIGAAFNDLGFLAVARDGQPGFRLLLGGGLATYCVSGLVAEEFLPAAELLEAGEAVIRVFHRVGNRQNRAQARMKFAVRKLGAEAFLELYRAEREVIRQEGGRPLDLPAARPDPELPSAPADRLPPHFAYAAFARDNVRPQRQAGFSTVTIRLRLGDITAAQLRALAALVETLPEREVRTTHEQNLLLRFVPDWRLPEVHRALFAVGLARIGARTIVDLTSCPGASSCKLAVTASRGLADLLGKFLEERPDLAGKARDLQLKVSGCPNSCGQHHVAGIGFQGGAGKVGGRFVPTYHVFLGGGVDGTGASFGRLAAKVPARRVPQALERLIGLYDAEKTPGEPPAAFFRRVDLERVRALLADLVELRASDATEQDFVDLGADVAFTPAVGKGECAA